jgi:hypothetical protein
MMREQTEGIQALNDSVETWTVFVIDQARGQSQSCLEHEASEAFLRQGACGRAGQDGDNDRSDAGLRRRVAVCIARKEKPIMKNPELVFIGIKGSIVALNRATGAQVWATHLKGSGFVNVVEQNDIVLAACRGEVFCLDALTGNARWHNPLRGFGLGLATIAGDIQNTAVLAEKRRRDEEAAASAAAAG